MNTALLVTTLVTALGTLGTTILSLIVIFRRRSGSATTITIRTPDQTINITGENSEEVYTALNEFLSKDHNLWKANRAISGPDKPEPIDYGKPPVGDDKLLTAKSAVERDQP